MFGKSKDYWNEKKAIFTCSEIYQQPDTWKKTFRLIQNQKYEIESFLKNVVEQDDFDIIFTGAGTSEYVGNTVVHYLNQKYNHKVKSYGTTDIVLHPQKYLSENKPTLLISFGRSGDSPESVGAVALANKVCKKIYHLFITCNEDGALARDAKNRLNAYAIVLPSETLDKSFAMTSSYTNMCLAALLCLDLNHLDDYEKIIHGFCECGEELLYTRWKDIQSITENFDFKKIVYLGSNSLKGTAQESQLKMLELTQGKVSTMFDSPLGFRHGPKSIIDDSTLVVLYVSDYPYTRKYEYDLAKEISLQRKNNKLMIVGNTDLDEFKELADYSIQIGLKERADNAFLGLVYVMAAQLLALYKSILCDIYPDDPCPSGEVNRVVTGVTLYSEEEL